MEALTFLSTRVSLFAGVADEQLEPLVAVAELKSFGAGQTILFKGATVDGLHIVCGGVAAVSAKVMNKGQVLLAELGVGEVFGEMSIVEMGTASATVKAGAEGATILMIPQEAFRHLLQLDEAFAVRVNTLMMARKTPAALPA